MKPRNAVRALLGLLLIAEIASVFWLRKFHDDIEWQAYGGQWTIADVERHIAAELPPLADPGQVEAWMIRHGFMFGYSTDTEGNRIGDQSHRELAGLKAEDLSGTTFGLVEPPNTFVDWEFNGRIELDFFYDKQGRLVKRRVDSFTYEP